VRPPAIPDSEIRERFVRASGPGGQNVNKVATAVELRFDVRASTSLSAEMKERLLALAGRRATGGGAIVILAQRHRTQERNRADARARLMALLAAAAARPKPRRETGVPRAQKEKRRSDKRRRSETKSLRRRVDG
jgi:ribosome-associated protein